ncbi:adenine phosphoribosyltransferase [Prochlorococcus marinus XMU1411]|uniref:adenine phosphoribosyltransferase n=1 Tax=Prochlorococcus marinus TaxID=1219 RepID=UPI001ADC00A3|nr:adenine phosphoribosyltransferase [Prochlorococcus marinus]MBO8244229.1 adenine phosphoribosyltransferase [Prochlorococcus marinus XMU1411]MBW3055315.1 adenine phosphoribosyltransferase [Prochlorococcus marinus str. MU1411]MCR8537057.1 adenine phosphoribosyltransferase [Prochlorococcus marinus CUG1430]
MKNNKLKFAIDSYKDFPIEGIVFRDVLPILKNPEVFNFLIKKMSSNNLLKSSDAIIAIDARGFIFGSAISFHLAKPLIVARKPGKLPGEIISKSYDLEYASNSLSIQKNSISDFQTFFIIDDLLATGGTVNCVVDIINSQNKQVTGLSVVIELKDLNAKSKFNFPVESQLIY